MQYSTSVPRYAMRALLRQRTHLLVVLSFVALAILGQPPQACDGWVVYAPVTYAVGAQRRRCCQTGPGPLIRAGAGWWYLSQSWRVPLVRSVVLGGAWFVAGYCGPIGMVGWPWARWVWQGAGEFCPRLRRQPEWLLIGWLLGIGERVLLATSLGLALVHGVQRLADSTSGLPVGLWGAGALVEVHHERERGQYEVKLQGEFTLAVADGDPFRLRMLILFLRLLEGSGERRGSRRTREGRTPLVRQEYLAEACEVYQPRISVWEGYWQKGDWRRLLSLKSAEVLTLELQQRIIATWARWPLWGETAVYHRLVQQGVAVTESQVRQAAEESGWDVVRQVLGRLCVQRGEELRLRDGWLVGDLLAQIEVLLHKLEQGQGLTPEEHWEVRALQATGQEAGLQARPVQEAVPWLRRLEQVLFAPWAEVPAHASGLPVCCPTCGSSHVGRKGRQGRAKTFMDEQGQLHEVEVYRYRCHNPACHRRSFTLFPPGLVPYSRLRAEVHVLALQMYAWGYSTYRRTAQALGVTSMTVYRWVSAFGDQLLPMAALFGMVRSSGVVGVDEKWVQVPKNNKDAGEQRKWMYVYVAVDAYTYDLLHIAIYPHNTAESAHAFLLALRGKGYHPQVVVTDLRQDYGPLIARVFPHAQHHECLFHASQAMHRHLAEIYGWEALHHDPQVIALGQAFDGPLAARTQHAAQQGYDTLMARRQEWVQHQPALDAVFASLEAHWPTLRNGIESDRIPRTNNTTELVIRRFDQHYQNFCGFDSLPSASRYLAVFEKVDRFTPFSDDAQPRIRGQSPLQLAGYDVAKLPMAAACSGWAILLPTRASLESVPNA